MSALQYGPPRDDDERAALARILSDCFGRPANSPIELTGEDTTRDPRVVRVNGTVAGGLWFVPMAQWYGGRSVPMHGIAAVGTDPAFRGQGVANHLMQSAVREMHERGIALSGLYPATQTLYRKVGYELAGSRYAARIPPQRIHIKDYGASVREVGEADRDAVRQVHSAYARRFNGHLERGPYCWDRVYEWRGEPTRGFLIEENGKPTGYLFKLHVRTDTGFYEVFLTDVAVLTPGAARRAWTFLADHGSMVPWIEWHSSPEDPLVTLLPELGLEMKLTMLWMNRIVDVGRAMESRGYSPAVRDRLDFEIRDDVIAANAGRFVLEVEGGKGKLKPGGAGTIRVDIRGLASLYSGFLPPENLRIQGLLEAPDDSLGRLHGVFAGPSPWMPDMF